MGFWNRISPSQPAADNPAAVVSQILAALTGMADEPAKEPEGGDSSGAAVAEPEAPKGKSKRAAKPKDTTKPVPKKPPHKPLPPWKVLLHNDDKNDMLFVVDTIVELTPLNKQDAELRMKEANKGGVALLLVTHKERAELYKDQFESKGLTVTIEPAEK